MSIYGAGAQHATSPLTGNELVPIDGGGAVGAVATTQQIANLAAAGEAQQIKDTAITTAGAGVLTAAGLVGGQIVRSGPSAAFTDTTASAAQIVAALGGFVANATFFARIKNTTAFVETLAAGTNVTLPSTVIIGPEQEGWYYGTVGGTAATPTVTFTHMFTSSIGLAQSVTTPQAGALNTVGAGTVTAALIAGGIVVRGGTQSNTAFTDTTDTATAIVAASVGLVNKVGGSQILIYKNNTDANATIAGGTGVTVSGVTVVPGGCTAIYVITQTAANTLTMVGILLTPPSVVSGTFTANGASAVTVADTRITANSSVVVTLKTVGGTVGAIPAIKTITPGTGFTIAGTASDTSVYNYLILN